MPHASSSSKLKPAPPSLPATVSLTSLRNCLLNLPSTLVSVLVAQNTPAQNVVVELVFRATATGVNGVTSAQKTAFAGWTGMSSKRKPTAGMPAPRSGAEEAVVEMDPAFARNVGLSDGSKVSLQVHVDPPTAHTIHIEPLTSSDWEIIELHASFLELNLLAQVRCVSTSHPLSVYLSPTSTASVQMTRLEPESALSSPTGFAKISPDAEVIVAPKTRQRRSSRGAKSTTSTAKGPLKRKDPSGSGSHPVFLRAVVLPIERHIPLDEEDDDDEIDIELQTGGKGFSVYLDPVLMTSRVLRGVEKVVVSVIRPSSLMPPKEDSDDKDKDKVRLVASVQAWESAPDSNSVAISKLLAADLLLYEGEVGQMIRLEPAPAPIPTKLLSKIKIHPYQVADKEKEKDSAAVRWGSGTKRLEEQALNRLLEVLGPRRQRNGTKAMIEEDRASLSPGEGTLEGPLTDGMVLPAIKDSPIASGGTIEFEVAPTDGVVMEAPQGLWWYQIGDKKPTFEISTPFPKPHLPLHPETFFVPDEKMEIIGVDAILRSITDSLLSQSSVLLTGAHGSGKSSILRLIAQRLSGAPHFFRVIDPGSLSRIAEERIGTVKELINRWFSEASWYAGKSSCSLILLDDLDRLCAAESENQDNTRIRQLSEVLVSTVRKIQKPIVLLASSQAKESLHSLLVGGHVFRDLIPLKAFTKETRRQVLEGLIGSRASASHCKASPNLDLREIAAQTEGYMPGDLSLLIDRARSESITRILDNISDSPNNDYDDNIALTASDFTSALSGFVPASLRGVKLQQSGASWSDIGGLSQTKQILLETLEWPTKYAPIFNSCPLRLRSGLLLYGYPGCGKTLLASAVAGECGLNFISVKGPEILNKYIGASEKSVRDLFERAQGARPCVLFFDEFDSIAPKRGHDSTGVTDRVVNQMLTQMDGAEGLEGVYVLAATSRPDLIDPALLRPGRLDKSLICDLPDFQDRIDILRAVGQKVVFEQDVELEEIAKRTEGYSGADLQAVVYNAHLEAVQGVLGEEEKERQREEEGQGNTDETREDLNFLEFVYGSGNGAKGKGKGKGIASDMITSKGKDRGLLVEKLLTLRNPSHAHHHKHARQTASQQEENKKDEIRISYAHLEISLQNTRPSISTQEKERLNRIYEEFLGQREGNFPVPGGSKEVGGRSSLM